MLKLKALLAKILSAPVFTDTGTLVTKSYGTLYYIRSPFLGIAILRWIGNTNVPTEQVVEVSTPTKLVPLNNANFGAPIARGDLIEVQATVIRLRLTTTAASGWGIATLIYPLNKRGGVINHLRKILSSLYRREVTICLS